MFIMSSRLNICTYGKQKYDCGMIDYIYGSEHQKIR